MYRAENDYLTTIVLYKQFIDSFDVLPFDKKCCSIYGNIRSYLDKNGSPIGPNDLLIASIAIANNCVLVTHNIKELSRVPGLICEDWSI